MKLYEIPEEMRALEAQIADAEGELTPEIEERLEQLSAKFADVAEYIALLVREASAEAEAIKVEEQRLRDRRKAVENRADRLRNYIHEQMQIVGTQRIHGNMVTLTIQRNSRPSVRWTEGEDIPEAFVRIKRELDSRLVLDHIAMFGETPKGAIVEQGSHLRIR